MQGEQIKERIRRLTDEELNWLCLLGDELAKEIPQCTSWKSKKGEVDLDRKKYVELCLTGILDIRYALQLKREFSNPSRPLPAFTHEFWEKIRPKWCQSSLPRDEILKWQQEHGIAVREALARAIRGPMSLYDLTTDIIVWAHQTAPYGSKHERIAKALDGRGIPYTGGCKEASSWAQALSLASGKTKAFFSTRYKRATEIQS